MPNPDIEALTPQSSDATIKAARTSCVASEIAGGKERDQAVAMCYDMISRKIGREWSGGTEVAPAQ